MNTSANNRLRKLRALARRATNPHEAALAASMATALAAKLGEPLEEAPEPEIALRIWPVPDFDLVHKLAAGVAARQCGIPFLFVRALVPGAFHTYHLLGDPVAIWGAVSFFQGTVKAMQAAWFDYHVAAPDAQRPSFLVGFAQGLEYQDPSETALVKRSSDPTLEAERAERYDVQPEAERPVQISDHVSWQAGVERGLGHARPELRARFEPKLQTRHA